MIPITYNVIHYYNIYIYTEIIRDMCVGHGAEYHPKRTKKKYYHKKK